MADEKTGTILRNCRKIQVTITLTIATITLNMMNIFEHKRRKASKCPCKNIS